MHPWWTFKHLLTHCRPRPKVGLRRRKVQLHARTREGPDDCRRQQVNCAFFRPQKPSWVRWLFGNHIPPSSSKRAGPDTQMGQRRAHNLAWILPRRYFLPSSYFWSGGSFKAFENALSNFALWADIFISALEGACTIQNLNLKELINVWGCATDTRWLIKLHTPTTVFSMQSQALTSKRDQFLSMCGSWG